jgi:4-hydroxy-4-methyl-2-oxoglutarate aldolase
MGAEERVQAQAGPMADAAGHADLMATLTAQGSATLGACGALIMRARIRAAWPGATVCGPAFTASCAVGDNLAIHVAAAEAPAGSVIVAETAGEPELGYWGEVLTTGAQARGVTGLVIDAGVRDTAALAARGFGAFSSMVALPSATKNTPGSVGGPVTVGDIEVRTGDWVIGDADGVVAIRAGDLEAVVAASVARSEDEQRLFAALEAGATTIDLLHLDPTLITRHDP